MTVHALQCRQTFVSRMHLMIFMLLILNIKHGYYLVKKNDALDVDSFLAAIDNDYL